MLLTQLLFRHYGPFATEATLHIEHDLTILTGANDCGKTSVLNLIQRVCGIRSPNQVIQQHEVNIDRIGDATCTWEDDHAIGCTAYFLGTEFSGPHHVAGEWGLGDEMELEIVLPPQRRKVELQRWKLKSKGKWSQGGNVALKALPTVIRLPLADSIQSVIDLANPNETEIQFLRAAFGQNFSFDKYKSTSDGAFYSIVSKARGDANQKLRSFLPDAVAMEFEFQSVKGERNLLSVQLRDAHSGHTPLGLRGAGIQRMVSLMGCLLSIPLTTGHHIILLDEPESSLHADAQHSLRHVLEAIAAKPNFQVIYATHSPSMINTMTPSSIRVIARTQTGERATSIISHRPFADNYLLVRSSLGITPADSLLFANVTLIVEGATEVLGVPLLLNKLHQGGIAGFEDVPLLLSQMHIVDGCGDSFEYLCRLAQSHAAKPLIFLDADKNTRVTAVRSQHPDVPIVILDGREEFEELLPREVYFSALSGRLREFADYDWSTMTAQEFDAWDADARLPEKMVFTKRVERWLQDKWDGLSLDKPQVMKRAIDLVEPHTIQTGKLLELMNHSRNLLV